MRAQRGPPSTDDPHQRHWSQSQPRHLGPLQLASLSSVWGKEGLGEGAVRARPAEQRCTNCCCRATWSPGRVSLGRSSARWLTGPRGSASADASDGDDRIVSQTMRCTSVPALPWKERGTRFVGLVHAPTPLGNMVNGFLNNHALLLHSMYSSRNKQQQRQHGIFGALHLDSGRD